MPLNITKLVTLQVQDKPNQKRKHFKQNRMSLWNSFHDIWTPSGRQFNFQPFEQQAFTQVQTNRKSNSFSREISRIQQSIENKQKILEETYLPKKVRTIPTQVQIMDAPQIKSLSILNYKRSESRSQTSRTQSATPMMRRSKRHQKPIEIKDTIGLYIEKCLLYDRYPKEKIKLDYTLVELKSVFICFIPHRRQKSNVEQSRQPYNRVEYKHSITLAKWDQSERSDELF